MYCPKCGQTNPSEAKFCGKCGSAMALVETPVKNVTSGGHAEASTPAVTPALKTGIIVGSIFFPILGIIMGVIYLLDANPEKKTVGRLWLIVGGVAALVWIILMK